MKAVRIHKKLANEVENLDFSLKRQLAELFAQLADGENLGMPVSRPMPVVEHGVHELRVKDRTGQYRIFYFTKKADAILIFLFLRRKRKRCQDKKLKPPKTA